VREQKLSASAGVEVL